MKKRVVLSLTMLKRILYNFAGEVETRPGCSTPPGRAPRVCVRERESFRAYSRCLTNLSKHQRIKHLNFFSPIKGRTRKKEGIWWRWRLLWSRVIEFVVPTRLHLILYIYSESEKTIQI